ncbi:MAG: CHAT domain-containing protein [Syntrophaceae bacterium]|nr:CHAT domain-containing protein [Syntrophaceae bacterium]
MRELLIRRIWWLGLMSALLGLWGCARWTQTLPSAAGFPAPVELSGPYDADIPPQETRALAAARRTDDWAVPYLFLRVAGYFKSRADEGRCLHFLDRAAAEFRRRGNAPGEASAAGRKMAALVRFGRMPETLLTLQTAEFQWSSFPLKAFPLCHRGAYFFKTGDYAAAQNAFRMALEGAAGQPETIDWLTLQRDAALGYAMATLAGGYFPVATARLCLQDLGAGVDEGLRDAAADAVAHLEQVSLLNERIRRTQAFAYDPASLPPSVVWSVDAYRGLGLAVWGKTAEAAECLEMVRRLAQTSGDPIGEADSLFFINHLYLLTGNAAAGAAAARSLAELADRYQLVSYGVWAQFIAAHHFGRTGHVEQTISALDAALALVEENISWLARQRDFRGICAFGRPALYERLLELYTEKKDFRAAFQTAERAKAAALADRLWSDETGPVAAASEGFRKISACRRRLAQASTALWERQAASFAFEKAAGEVRGARRTCAALGDEIKTTDPRLWALLGAAPPGVEKLQTLLDANTTLFAYAVREKSLYIWAIHQNRIVQEKLPLSRSEVERLTRAWRETLMTRDRQRADALGEKVYDALLKPVIPFVHGDRIGVVPDETLYNLPLAAMRYVKSYLVDGFTLFQLPHTGLLGELPQQPSPSGAGRAVIIAGAPCVKTDRRWTSWAAAEMEALHKVFPRADYLFLNDTSAWRMPGPFPAYDAIHLVLRQYPVGKISAASCASGAADVRQTADPEHDGVFRHALKGAVAVWSVCLPPADAQMEQIGLAAAQAAWLYAVSPVLVTQLWDVEDRSKALFFELFYKNLAKSGSAADALRAAQNAMIAAGNGPSVWAAFVLTGR